MAPSWPIVVSLSIVMSCVGSLSRAQTPAASDASVEAATPTVYYATNRRVETANATHNGLYGRFGDKLAVFALVVGAIYCRSEWRAGRRRGTRLGVVTMVASISLLAIQLSHRQSSASPSIQEYSADRGTLAFGKHLELSHSANSGVGSIGASRDMQFADPSQFFRELDASVLKSEHHEVLLFVHGFNVEFRLAIEDSKQLARSLSFDGTSVCFSWPSQGSVLDYTVDEANAEWSIAHFKKFLIDLSNQTHASSIHIIAHSMGNRLLTESVREMAAERATKDKPLGHVFLAAPDVDADRFRDELAEPLRQLSRTVTIYTSSKDQALALSRRLHGSPRLGDSTLGPVIVDGIETVDVTDTDLTYLGHGYYEEDKQVLFDIFQVLRHHREASKRVGLVADRQGQATYWRLKPVRFASSTSPDKSFR